MEVETRDIRRRNKDEPGEQDIKTTSVVNRRKKKKQHPWNNQLPWETIKKTPQPLRDKGRRTRTEEQGTRRTTKH